MRVTRIVIAILLPVGGLLTQACSTITEDRAEIKVVADFLNEVLPDLEGQRVQLGFARAEGGNAQAEVVVTCNSSGDSAFCGDQFADACTLFGGGASSEPGGGDTCSVNE